jgi:hypothetical protein
MDSSAFALGLVFAEYDHRLAAMVAGLVWATARFVLNRETAETRESLQIQPLKDARSIACTRHTP